MSPRVKKAVFSVFLMLFAFNTWAASGLDAYYRLERVKRSVSGLVPSSGVGFYQKVLRRSLASSCNFYPNDSLKAQLDFKRCSPFYSVFSAMERFFKEPDAAYLGFDVIQIRNKNYFFDLPVECSFFQ